mgnify:FL=1
MYLTGERMFAMKNKKKLPVGIESFYEIIQQNFYYVDKTQMIADLLYNWGKVNLFTRPRRFGKSLNMSMLKAFFEIGCDKTLFEGLAISRETELCQKYMGKFPVISISLKSVDGSNFLSARNALTSLIGKTAMDFAFLSESSQLSEPQKKTYEQLIQLGAPGESMFIMSEDILTNSLQTLSGLLAAHYGQQVILLIDEYDVPLDKAFQNGYYEEMVTLIRNMFGSALKTNASLYFAVLTGCLRIAKESIFTGLNNFYVISITDVEFNEYFGFTDKEVQDILSDYELQDHYDAVKEWYDGYRFGNSEIYCPWDVLTYCKKLRADPNAIPENYWLNTSGNNMVRRFIDKADGKTRNDIERLIAGEEIRKEVHQELTYSELDSTIENLWSVLFTTGYLTSRGRAEGELLRLVIPNREIRNLFIRQIREWFQDTVKKDAPKLDRFCNAFPAGNASLIEDLFNEYLWNTISIRDTAAPYGKKENFYHGILLGLLSHREEWRISSNTESGIGYSDILAEIFENRTGIVIEVKYAENGNLEASCKEALEQIEEKKYEVKLRDDGMRKILKYGIACYKKECRVELTEECSCNRNAE